MTAGHADNSPNAVANDQANPPNVPVSVQGREQRKGEGALIENRLSALPTCTVPPFFAALAGPLEGILAKLSLLAENDSHNDYSARWPTSAGATISFQPAAVLRDEVVELGPRPGDTPIHLMVSAMPSAADMKHQVIEKMIRDVLEEDMWDRPQSLLRRDAQGAMPLHRAIALGRLELAAFLMQMAPSAQALSVDNCGRSALHYLVRQGWMSLSQATPLVHTLCANGASWTRQDFAGVTPEDQMTALPPDERTVWRGLASSTGLPSSR